MAYATENHVIAHVDDRGEIHYLLTHDLRVYDFGFVVLITETGTSRYSDHVRELARLASAEGLLPRTLDVMHTDGGAVREATLALFESYDSLVSLMTATGGVITTDDCVVDEPSD